MLELNNQATTNLDPEGAKLEDALDEEEVGEDLVQDVKEVSVVGGLNMIFIYIYIVREREKERDS